MKNFLNGLPSTGIYCAACAWHLVDSLELSEVSYLDQVSLFALDHPAAAIFTNEKFKGPPYPAFWLYQVEQRIYPKAAHDDQARDVRLLIVRRDGRYPDQFARTELGVAESHALELDFSGAAPSGDAVLMLNGWVDWPDGSTFRAAAQTTKAGLLCPTSRCKMPPEGGSP